ncbi:pyruvate dehydrogenase complex dihydrolipoamide acetyltransferase [Paracoccaceae bacterium GXU_MW_L88]
MPTEILMPALSPTMEEGTLAKWLVKEGDEVNSGDIIAEIETDKATMEFEAVDEGTIGKILIEEGSEGVKVNTPIAVLLEDGESADDIKESGGDSGSKDAPKEEAKAESKPPEDDKPASDQKVDQPAAGAAPKKDGERIFSSPLARRIAKEKGIDLASVKGSGPKGRIVKADVENAKPGAAPAAEDKSDAGAAKAPAADASGVAKIYEGRNYEEVKLNGMRKTVAARLTEAKQTIPHFYLRREIILDELLSFRSQLNKQLEEKGVKLSVNDFVIKASALALQDVPDCNAVWAGDKILKMERSDVGVAVAVDGGLFVPVLKDADHKSLSALSAQMKDMAGRARDGKLSPEEYSGGSFAVSNLGMFGVENFDAVINPPHASILAVGAGVKKPVVDGDQVVVKTVMSVTLSVDHRVIDGALGAQWLQAFKGYIENPMTMLA